MIAYSLGTLEKDYEEVTKLCSRWWPESLFYKTYGIKYELDKKVFDYLNNLGILMVLLGKDEGKIVSCYIGLKHPYLFNPSIYTATEIVWCIDKNYRSFRNMLQLIKEIENLMKLNNIDLYFIALSGEEKYRKLGKVLTKHNFIEMDIAYSKYRRYINA